MPDLRYIHAADLHLDAPFQGITANSPNGEKLGQILHDSTFSALERLTNLALSERPDFVVLAGDVYNREDFSIRSQLKLRDACEKLNKAGIQVFIAHGNHDPLSSRLVSIQWPDNVTIFPADTPQTVPFIRDGETVALVQGISHGNDRESRDLAQSFKPIGDKDCFQLGVLHCAISGQSSDRYAPCSLEELTENGFDAWALGHVHERKTLSDHPFVAYPGNIQGLHINETGPRGCLVVEAHKQGSSWNCQSRFVPLGTVQWEILNISIDGLDSLQAVRDLMLQELETAASECPAHVRNLIVRVIFSGRSPLCRELYKNESQADLLEAASALERAHPAIWIKDILLEVNEFVPLEEMLQRDDLLGETVRVCEQLASSAEDLERMSNQVFEPLSGSRRRKRFRQPTSDELLALLNDARRICQDVLEGR